MYVSVYEIRGNSGVWGLLIVIEFWSDEDDK